MMLPIEPIDAPESDYLYIQASQIELGGNGLFTAIDVFAGEIIAIFKGEILSDDEAKRRSDKHQNSYFMNMADGRILDCFYTDGYAKYANDAEGVRTSNYKNNASIMLSDEGIVCLVAKKRIKKFEEIFCAYGKKYWEKFRALNSVSE